MPAVGAVLSSECRPVTITDLDVFTYRVPIAAPGKLGGQRRHWRDGMLVRLTNASGATGWGEAAPLPGHSRETLGEAQREVLHLRSLVTGKSYASANDWLQVLSDENASASVTCGLDLAWWNLVADERKISPAIAFAGESRSSVSINGLLMRPRRNVLSRAAALKEMGYTCLKLKVGRQDIDQEIALVHALRAVAGPTLSLRLDANRAWSIGQAITFMDGIRDLGVEYVEEPLDDPEELQTLASRCSVPIALDETVSEIASEDLGAYGWAHAIVLKPMLLGGITAARRLVNRALDISVKPVISASFETGIGLLGLVMLSAACPADIPAGLDTYRWLKQDIIRPRLEVELPRVEVATLFQIPRIVAEESLTRVTGREPLTA